MVTNAMASSFRMHASASQVAAKSSGRYASKTPVESDDDYDNDDDTGSTLQSSRYRLMDEQAQRQEVRPRCVSILRQLLNQFVLTHTCTHPDRQQTSRA